MTNKITRQELDTALIASGVNPKWLVLGAIKRGEAYPDDLTDSQGWHAEDELLRDGLIYRDEMTGDLVAR